MLASTHSHALLLVAFVFCYFAAFKVKGETVFNFTIPSDKDFYEKQTDAMEEKRLYNYVPENVENNINKYYNESEISMSETNDTSEVKHDFRNDTFWEMLHHENDSTGHVYQLRNQNLEQLQATHQGIYYNNTYNDSHLLKKNMTRYGSSENTKDYYKDSNTVKNVSLVKTRDGDNSVLKNERAGLFDEHLSEVSQGDFQYLARNNTDVRGKGISSNYAKRKTHTTDRVNQTEVNLQESSYDHKKKIYTKSPGMHEYENEETAQKGNDNYYRDERIGVETSYKDYSNKFYRENSFKDGKQEMSQVEKLKNVKTSFVKKMLTKSPSIGDSSPEQIRKEYLEVGSGNTTDTKSSKPRSYSLEEYQDQMVEDKQHSNTSSPSTTPAPLEKQNKVSEDLEKVDHNSDEYQEYYEQEDDDQDEDDNDSGNGEFYDQDDYYYNEDEEDDYYQHEQSDSKPNVDEALKNSKEPPKQEQTQTEDNTLKDPLCSS